MDTARANGFSVAAHCHADSAISDCIRAGVHTIEHATHLSERTTDLLMEAEDTYLVLPVWRGTGFWNGLRSYVPAV